MIRTKGMTAGAFEVFLRTLREEPRYMSNAGLKVLRHAFAENMKGKTRSEWPRILLIVNKANAIQKKPLEFSRLVTSYMKSALPRMTGNSSGLHQPSGMRGGKETFVASQQVYLPACRSGHSDFWIPEFCLPSKVRERWKFALLAMNDCNKRRKRT